MKYITFLGLGPRDGYSELITFFEGDEENISCTKLVQHHIYENYKDQIDKIYVFETQQSHDKYFTELCNVIPQEIVEEVLIDQNISSEKFVDHLINILEDSDEVILDVTHSFRKIPIRLLFALRYVEAMKDVKIRSIFYGEVEKQNTDQQYSIVHDLVKDYQLQKVAEYLSQFDRTLIIRKKDWEQLSLGDKTIENLLNSLAAFNEMTEFCNLDKAVQTVQKISENARAIENQKNKATGSNPYIMLVPLAKQIQKKFQNIDPRNSDQKNLIEIIRIMIEHERYQLAITFTDELFGRELIRNTIDPKTKKFDVRQMMKKTGYRFYKVRDNRFSYFSTQYLKERLGIKTNANILPAAYDELESALGPFEQNIKRLQSICTQPSNLEVIHHFSDECRNVINHASGSARSGDDLKLDIRQTVFKMLKIIEKF
ncbi:CRISPR-associated DxTHG motif protein [Erysipelotrichaceae bacterium RD49]|nr:CRISPR-associated DxTHG motif protein [Erysipelotrichaceae bacterium RD49]